MKRIYQRRGVTAKSPDKVKFLSCDTNEIARVGAVSVKKSQ